MENTRAAAVQGRFYPAGEEALTRSFEGMIAANRYPVRQTDGKIIGAVLPHAGHVYSGWQTIPLFLTMKAAGYKPDSVVLIHPNHTGYGEWCSLDTSEYWETGLGITAIDTDLGELTGLPYSSAAHHAEHSAEVILPFLQYFFGVQGFSFLPVCMYDQSADAVSRVSKALSGAIGKKDGTTLLIASSDFSHYMPPDKGRAQDQFLLDAVFAKDPERIIRTAREKNISACGYGPIAAVTAVLKELYTDFQVTEVARGHSGEVYPSEQVVDYISLLFSSSDEDILA